MRRALPVLLAAALLVAAHPSEGPGYHHADEERDVFFTQQEAWLTATTARVGNVDHENTEWAGWSSEAPTDPAGGGTVATAVSGFREIFEDEGQDKGQMTAEGTFTGWLDSITMELHFAAPFQELCDLNVAVDLDVDGIPVLDMDGTGGPVEVYAEPNGETYIAKLKITNVFALLDGYGYAGAVDTEHTVHVSVQQFPLCNEAVWLYGSSSTPSAITFNVDPTDPSVAQHTTYDATNPPVDPAA